MSSFIVSDKVTDEWPSFETTVERKPFVPSVEQGNILAQIRVQRTHVEGEALAGTGKTSTIREAMWQLADQGISSVYSCFNAHVAKEFQQGLPSRSRASTFNSLGHQILKSHLNPAFNEDKIDMLAEKFFPGWNLRVERRAVVKLVNLCRSLLHDGEDPIEVLGLAADYGVEMADDSREDIVAVVPEVLRADLEMTSIIDFGDQIYMPVKMGLSPSRPIEVLAVDEAQDLNPAQHAMVRQVCPKGRVIVIGDRKQAIYGWRGADVRSMDTLREYLSQTDRNIMSLPLTVTRRCPVQVVKLAQRLVPLLDHLPDAEQGTVAAVDERKLRQYAEPGTMFLCRTNAPLVSEAYRLIRSGIRATVRGRDIGRGLNVLIARLRAKSVPDLIRRVSEHRSAEMLNLAMLRNPDAALQALEDKCECLTALCEGATSVDEVKSRAETLFTDVSEANAVVLSSIHRAKGLEADRVVVLRPDLLPGPWARTSDEYQQERNLAYVACTRAKRELFFAGFIPGLFS